MSKPACKAIVIGASAGAVEALSTILPVFPADYPIPIMIVVHLPPDKKSVMAEVLQTRTILPVREAEDKIKIETGIYIGPPDYHLMVEKNGYLSLSADAPVLYSRPSIDVLFETAADAYRENLTGVILTGANSDGALGLKAVMKAGGQGIVQTPDHAYAKAMPQSALHACPNAQSLSLDQISLYLLNIAQRPS